MEQKRIRPLDGDVTDYKDMDGKDIRIGSVVIVDGLEFDVIVNDFNGVIAIDGPTGQAPLAEHHHLCRVIS